ncbi:MAG: hypothetical protein M5U01_13615 [Ardenticatenaceae bacterium]|nr:hypothetical protein [Ardenticatenaceae bacterium]
MTDRPQLETCPICGHDRAPQHMSTCRECGERYCKRCSALRYAQANAMWSESWFHVPDRWEGRCTRCLEREMATTSVTCAACRRAVPHCEIFWGERCDKCADYVCYDCARTRQRAGGAGKPLAASGITAASATLASSPEAGRPRNAPPIIRGDSRPPPGATTTDDGGATRLMDQ